MASGDRVHYTLSLGDLAEDALVVTRVEGREGVSEPYRFDVDFVTRDGSVDLAASVGKPALLVITRSTGEERAVHGEAIRVELTGVAAGAPRYRATIAPRLLRLLQARRSRVYQGKSVPEIVDAVLGEHGVAHRAALSGSYPAREYVLQYRETDLAFVSRLLELEGIWYRFDHSRGGHELVLGDAPGAFGERPGTLEIRPESAQGDGDEHLTTLARTRRATSTKAVQRDFDFERPGVDLTATEGDGALEVYEYPGVYTASGEGTRRAKTRLDELRHAEDAYAGEGNAVGTVAGAKLDVDRAGSLVVLRVRHRGQQEQAAGAAEAVRSTYRSRFEAIPASQPFRPPRATPVPRADGIETATVVGPSGEEIHTDAHGRIRVRFHWDREGPNDDGACCWVRVAQAWAGAGMGAVFLPRIGHEVVVRFLDGDPDRPLVTGSVYNGANPPPESLPADKTKSTLRTATSTGSSGNNELRFEDAAGAEEIFIHAQKDANAEIGHDATELVQRNQHLEVGGDRARQVDGFQSLQVTAEDATTIDGSATLTVVKNRTTGVGLTHTEEIGGSNAVTVGHVRHVTVAMASAESVGAAAALNVGGAYVVNVGGALNHAVGGLKATQVGAASIELVGASRDETVGKDRNSRTGGDAAFDVDGSVTLTIDGEASDDVGGAFQIQVKEGDALDAQAGTLEADALKVMVGGKVMLELSKSGAMKLSGSEVLIDGTSIKLKGSPLKKIGGAGPSSGPAKVAPPADQKKKTMDWKIECGHHGKGLSRPVFQHINQIAIVPEKGETYDRVAIAYKNEETTPPGSLKMGPLSVKEGPADGAYHTYPFDAEYKGDLAQKRFWLTSFWKSWREVTTYRVENAPLPVEVRVYNPRQYKIELSFPSLKGYKGGEKYSRDVKPGFKLDNKVHETTKEVTGWSPSKFKESKKESTTTRKYNTAGNAYRATFKTPPEKEETKTPPIAFYIDDNKVELDLLDAIGKFKEIADSFKKIVESFQENTPQIGWYVQYDLQLMQGTLAAEWYWKEWRDQSVFTYIDVCIELKIIELTLEAGLGLRGLGFKAQIYAAITGGISLKLDGCREQPSGPPGFTVPLKGELSGKIGGRVEAGNLLKADANGKTGIEIGVALGVNRKDRASMLSFDFTGTWSGFTVTATVSGGLFGIGGTKTWTKKLADEKKLFECQWPKEQEHDYAPPVASPERIRAVILESLTAGLDVKIASKVGKFYQFNEYLDLEKVADELARAVVSHSTFDRSPDMVKGLGDGIRGDLTAKAKHGYVLESDYRAYLNGGLQARLDAMVPASNNLAQPRA